MKKFIQPLVITILTVILLTACSKQAKIKKQLAGDWTITEVVAETIINGGTPDVDTNNSETTTTFAEDGTGTASSSGSVTNPFPKNFTWSNTETILNIIDTDNSITTVYNVLEHYKNKIVLHTTWSETVAGDDFVFIITITMNKE